MHYARNNFDAMRPAPICQDASTMMGHCPNIHISTNCYHGFHHQKQIEDTIPNDCEMQEVPEKTESMVSNSRKRSADDHEYPQMKKQRAEVQRKQRMEPDTKTKEKVKIDSEDLLELLYWNIHGGNLYHLF